MEERCWRSMKDKSFSAGPEISQILCNLKIHAHKIHLLDRTVNQTTAVHDVTPRLFYDPLTFNWITATHPTSKNGCYFLCRRKKLSATLWIKTENYSQLLLWWRNLQNSRTTLEQSSRFLHHNNVYIWRGPVRPEHVVVYNKEMKTSEY
jgi:hypothetical protein